jgi:hypothetical protein
VYIHVVVVVIMVVVVENLSRSSSYRSKRLFFTTARRWNCRRCSWFCRQTVQPIHGGRHDGTPTTVGLVRGTVLDAHALDRRLNQRQMTMVESRKQVVFDLQVQSVG